MADRITRMVISIQDNGLYLIATEAGPIMSADNLCREEALGCIASWIYAHRDHGTVPQYMETPEQREATKAYFAGRGNGAPE